MLGEPGVVHGELQELLRPIERVRFEYELVGLGFRGVLDLLYYSPRYEIPVHLNLGVEHAEPGSVQLGYHEPRVGEHLLYRLPGKEAQVGVVHQAERLVLESALQEREPHAAVGHVRDGGHYVSFRAQEGFEPLEHLQRLSQVLQHVSEDDHVERSLA